MLCELIITNFNCTVMLLKITRCKVSLMQHFINYLKFQALQALEFPSENEQQKYSFLIMKNKTKNDLKHKCLYLRGLVSVQRGSVEFLCSYKGCKS